MSDASIGVIGTLLGTVVGGLLSYLATWELKRRDDQRKRQALAMALLGEIRFLEFVLYRIYQLRSFDIPSTMVYDHAGDALLLFSAETVHAVTDLYQRTHVVSTLVTGVRNIQISSGGYLQIQWYAVSAAKVIPTAVAFLENEGGHRPPNLPTEDAMVSAQNPSFPSFMFLTSHAEK